MVDRLQEARQNREQYLSGLQNQFYITPEMSGIATIIITGNYFLVNSGIRVELLEKNVKGTMVKIRLQDGREGWLPAQAVNKWNLSLEQIHVF